MSDVIHGNGPPRSTIADLMFGIRATYAATASRGAWAPSTAYAAGDTVSTRAAPFVYRCYTAGTSDTGAGPVGFSSQSDASGTGWTPLVYCGERYAKQSGAPQRVLMLLGDGTLEPVPGMTPRRVADDTLGQYAADLILCLWGAENADGTDDLLRYADVEGMVDTAINIIRAVAPGRTKIKIVNPRLRTNVVTFGEDRQIHVTYSRAVPKIAAVWKVAQTPAPALDPMQPNGPAPNPGAPYIFGLTLDAEQGTHGGN